MPDPGPASPANINGWRYHSAHAACSKKLAHQIQDDLHGANVSFVPNAKGQNLSSIILNIKKTMKILPSFRLRG